jgi:hypothetical protein
VWSERSDDHPTIARENPMSRYLVLAGFVGVAIAFAGAAADTPPQAPVPPNPNIDMDGHLKAVREAAEHRKSHRVSEDDFIKMSQESGTIVLDARSKAKYDLLHVKGAINLNFSDITVESLAKTIPDKNTRILIYCNNNFQNAEQPFPTKAPGAALNISTFISLYQYGYRNVYELAPRLDPKQAKIEFESRK